VSSVKPSVRDQEWLLEAIELSRSCPEVATAYAVGAIVVDAAGVELARGYSRETDPAGHAEEAALAKLAGIGRDAKAGGGVAGRDLSHATIYTSLEPCSTRRSRPRTCARLIVASGLRRVVFALREPPILADGHGAELLRAAGVEVVEISELADLVRQVNAHLFNGAYSLDA
jgi:diaminohydroxyphosphoribosylaminopyrimidine deaminase / 5-amino-6-(5-phosphoribosylamino)uracil reductase